MSVIKNFSATNYLSGKLRAGLQKRQTDGMDSTCPLLLRNHEANQPNDMRVLQSNDGTGTTILHEVCRMYPSAELIEEIVRNRGESLANLVDVNGQLPLHVAAEWGASPDVIVSLLILNRDAASTTDASGRTPLILVCKSICDCSGAEPGGTNTTTTTTPILSKLDVAMSLCAAAPHTINVEDKAGKTALEYAIENKVERPLLKLLFRASYHEWKIRQIDAREDAREKQLLGDKNSRQQLAKSTRVAPPKVPSALRLADGTFDLTDDVSLPPPCSFNVHGAAKSIVAGFSEHAESRRKSIQELTMKARTITSRKA